MITIVGIGADGWDGLGATARAALLAAPAVMGSARQLALLPPAVGAAHELLPTPLAPALDALAARDALCLLASGDPMLHGIGATLARLVPPERLRVIPAVSSVALAAARLGWPSGELTVLSLVTAPVDTVAAVLVPGRRLLLLARDGGTADLVAAVLADRGWGASTLTVLSDLGGASEAVGPHTGGPTVDLAVLAVECRPDAGTAPLPLVPGLPDEAFDSDGALTRREVRAVVLAALRPTPGELLWDVGAGSGSIGIEWLRAGGGGALAVEPRPGRLERIIANAARLGVPSLRTVAGQAPAVLLGLSAPQAVFIGGGLSVAGVVERCWEALSPGGRLVATAVTLETETLVHAWRVRVGGRLTRMELSRAAPLGGFTAWRPELPIVVWEVTR